MLNILSFLWFLTGQIDMGSSWSLWPEALEGHKLVTRGVFGYCRHPLYTGLLYHTIPIALLTLNWLIALGWFFLFGLYFGYYRILVEERILVDLFGKEYLDYR